MQCFILTASVKSTLVVDSVYILTKLMEHIIKVNDTGYGACLKSMSRIITLQLVQLKKARSYKPTLHAPNNGKRCGICNLILLNARSFT